MAALHWGQVRPASAAEGGSSYYLPGLYGDFGVALTPDPGHYWFTTNTYYAPRNSDPVLSVRLDHRVDAKAYLNLIRGFWVADWEVLGARYVAAIRIPYLHISVDATIESPLGPTTRSFENVGLGDMGLIPASLYWNWGRLYVNLYETITAPTGDYDVTKLANVSRNQWAFDTVLALTWIDLDAGYELSAVPGVLVNTQNPTTKYRSGTEFHMDLMANKFFSTTFGVGLHGSYYQQLAGDSGAGAVLGPFKGEASSFGPAVMFRPKIAGKQGYIALKYLYEFNVKNRFAGELLTLTGGIKF